MTNNEDGIQLEIAGCCLFCIEAQTVLIFAFVSSFKLSPPIVAGLVIACVMSAIMSTGDSSLSKNITGVAVPEVGDVATTKVSIVIP